MTDAITRAWGGVACRLRRLKSKILYRWLPSWLAVRLLKSVCLVRGHRTGQHFSEMFRDLPSDEIPWCSHCGKESA